MSAIEGRVPPGRLARVVRSPSGAVGLLLLAVVLLAGLGAPWLAPADPLRTNMTMTTVFLPPSAEHPFGTDNLGRDVFSRVLRGIGLSVAVAAAGVAAGVVAGVLTGALAGMLGGLFERVTMRLMDAFLAFPLLVLAIAVAVALGRGPTGVFVAVAFVNLPIFARLARGQTLKITAMPYMTAAEVMGCGFARRLFWHVLPNLVNPVVVQATVALSFAVMIEAGLSFLGLGLQPPQPALGLMIAEAKAYIAVAPHLVLFPSLALVMVVVSFNLIGDALADSGGPTRHRR
jgi:peptide/nickel transport system permease protein